MKFAQKKYMRRQRFASNKRLKLGSIVGALRKDLIFHNPLYINVLLLDYIKCSLTYILLNLVLS